MTAAVQNAASAVELWARTGIESAMNRFNVGEAPNETKTKGDKGSREARGMIRDANRGAPTGDS